MVWAPALALGLVLLAAAIPAGTAQDLPPEARCVAPRGGDFLAALRAAQEGLAAGAVVKDERAVAWELDAGATASGFVEAGSYSIACYAGLSRAAVGTVLLVHGYQARALSFAPLARELEARGFNVVSMDLPGHGDSSGPPLTVDAYSSYGKAVEAVAAVCRGSIGGRLWALGHSLGALAVLDATLRDDVRFEGVVLVAPLTKTSCWGATVIGATLARPFIRSIPDGAGGKVPLSWVRGLIRWRGEAKSFAVRSTSGRVILGGKDRVTDVPDARRLVAAKLPRTEIVTVPWMGHHSIESRVPDPRLLKLVIEALNPEGKDQ